MRVAEDAMGPSGRLLRKLTRSEVYGLWELQEAVGWCSRLQHRAAGASRAEMRLRPMEGAGEEVPCALATRVSGDTGTAVQ